jgi:hypothetical protein
VEENTIRDSSEHAVANHCLRDCLEIILTISPTRVVTAWYSELLSAATMADEYHPTWLRFQLRLRAHSVLSVSVS